MENLHRLLRGQVRRALENPETMADDGRALLGLVSDAYEQFDEDRAILERSLELMQKELLEANSDMRAAFERVITSSIDGIFACDAAFNITVWNPGMEVITGVTREEASGRQLLEVFPRLEETGDHEALLEALAGEITIARESIYALGDGDGDRPVFFEIHFSPLRNEAGDRVGGLAIFRNITDRKLAEQALQDLSIRDPLTNLYNRRYFNKRIEEEISRATRRRNRFALLLCDLDHFKKVNDTYSHQFGDEILKATGEAIQEATRDMDFVFRWGGDEFIVILLVDNREGITDAGARIRERIVALGREKQIPLDLSIGVASFPEHGEDSNQLIDLADRALYIAKKRGDKIHIGEEEYELDDGVVQVVFQPIVDTLTGQVIGHEALSRASTGGASIQELFTKYRSIGKLLQLKEVCFRKQIEAAETLGLDRVFINVDFRLLESLGHRKKPADVEIILEISEKEALIDIEHHLEVSQKWRRRGFKFAFDDFGVGFISLPFLADLEPEYIKLDRLTILQAAASDEFREFLNHVVKGLRQYARQGIVAEGIESEEELLVAKQIGIHLVQGYLFGKPAPITRRRPGSVEPEVGTSSQD
ncbi:MAG: diguanylate cyclase [Planctomycetota bacterium]|nr:diguanylate cyclase [Planctomycetota bacterium]